MTPHELPGHAAVPPAVPSAVPANASAPSATPSLRSEVTSAPPLPPAPSGTHGSGDSPHPPAPRDESGRPAAGTPGAATRSRRFGPRPTRRQLVVAALVTAVGVAGAVTTGVLIDREPVAVVDLTEALGAIAAGDVVGATVRDRAATVTLELADGEQVQTRYPAAYADELTDALVAADVPLETQSGAPGFAGEITRTLIPLLVLLAVVVWVLRKAGPGGMVGGTRKKALETGEVPDVTFSDVAGADEAVDQLREMVQFLREPERFEAVGARRPRGALLVGPPGTGKTLLARAVAGEAEVPFFALAGSDFVETFVGVGARRVRDLFAEARKVERAIVFIDEIDAVGRARGGAGSNASDGERENTLISLLNEMDGFAGSGVVVLAATNRPDVLDDALTRPGRLDRQVQVPNPDRRGRTLILEVHTRHRPVSPDVDLVGLARQTPGMSGADLAQVVNEACMEAARRGVAVVGEDCFQAAVATVAMGRARTSALVTDFDRRVTAWHEAGHTLAAALLPDADDPVSVTIVPRGPAGGVTWMSGNDDVFLPRRKALAQLVVAMAGRAAEERLMDGEYTQGAMGDLQHATSLATSMVTKYGMTGFGYAQLDDETLRVGGAVAARAHSEVDRLLRAAHEEATLLVARHAATLDALAEALLVEETLSGGRVRQIVASHGSAAA
ncbi:ATP-dependent metallopeptidase FtsH/Yme1/Tma family protein [Actinotalea sp. Marseille-Q4924]|uniref:ATP-dependent metallopeptidase FtsH/Yme1/Tma family protein n=1 Tax=Actinotalea sp. Marseille-Q4924 TaxID=2866571 RepID=UPI001CE4407D|nr:AAA family ATPase [Actinotalea sp. Marseille-Q4924]